MKYKQLVFSFFYALTVSVVTTQAAEVCVVSLLGKEEDQRVLSSVTELLKKMGYENPLAQFDFKNQSIKNISECINGDYEEVILVMQSGEKIPGHQSLLFPVVDAIRGEKGWSVLDAHIFTTVRPGPRLRQLTLVTCDAEKVLDEYRPIRRLARDNDMHLRLQSYSLLALAFTGVKMRRLDTVAFTIAESAQDLNSKKIYCDIPTSLIALYEYGETTCLRSHFSVMFHGLVSAGFKSSHRWMAFEKNENGEETFENRFGFLDIELGLLKGLNLNISGDPASVIQESYGFSFAPMTYATATRLEKNVYR